MKEVITTTHILFSIMTATLILSITLAAITYLMVQFLAYLAG